jgi:hypothetical protein
MLVSPTWETAMHLPRFAPLIFSGIGLCYAGNISAEKNPTHPTFAASATWIFDTAVMYRF